MKTEYWRQPRRGSFRKDHGGQRGETEQKDIGIWTGVAHDTGLSPVFLHVLLKFHFTLLYPSNPFPIFQLSILFIFIFFQISFPSDSYSFPLISFSFHLSSLSTFLYVKPDANPVVDKKMSNVDYFFLCSIFVSYTV